MAAVPAEVTRSPATGRPLFGLDEADDALLGAVFAEAAGGLGLDGARIYAALREGRTLGEALGLPSRVGEALYQRAHNWFTAGRHDRAEASFRVLCILDGRDADHWVGYGVCLRMRDNRPEAELAFATAAALRPGWAVPHFHAASLAIARERWSDADAHLRAFETCRDGPVPEAMHREAARLAGALAERRLGTPAGA